MSSYSNARAAARKANPGVNTTQRSWSNYEGDTPNRSWVGSELYRDSSRYRAGGSDLGRFGGGNTTQRSWDNYVGKSKFDSREEEQEDRTQPSTPEVSRWQQLQDQVEANKTAPEEESKFKKYQRESALRRGMKSLQNSRPAVGSTSSYVV